MVQVRVSAHAKKTRSDNRFTLRRTCRLLGLSRSVLHYVSQRKDDGLQQRLVELAGERRRFGYRRLHVLVEREGFVLNHKRVHRLYREAGLAVRKRRKRERVAVERCQLQVSSGPNHTWWMDFVSDALANGRPINCLTVSTTAPRRLCKSRPPAASMARAWPTS